MGFQIHIRIELKSKIKDDIPIILKYAKLGYLPNAIANKTRHDPKTIKKVLAAYGYEI